MSSQLSDISGYLAAGAARGAGPTAAAGAKGGAAAKSGADLDMMDFLTLMIAQFQNQTMDNTASTTDMLNQLVQMSTIQAINNITDATVQMYSASLVGKEVTIGSFTSDGKLEEVVGVVTGTGVSGGQQVIFVNDKSYYLSDIMAVGRLPEIEDAEKPEGGGEGGEGGGSGEGGDAKPEEPKI